MSKKETSNAQKPRKFTNENQTHFLVPTQIWVGKNASRTEVGDETIRLRYLKIKTGSKKAQTGNFK